MRVIDISLPGTHALDNYTVVFAPRAGHHSNIAERVAVFMRDQGLTRMAVVEQKCATQIPIEIDGCTYHDDFSGQVRQYKEVLEKLLTLTHKPAHLVAVCQPGPLLLATLILNPHLGRTFGSAGSPMDTEGEWGFLPEFARLMGRGYINLLLHFLGQSVGEGQPGGGREAYDGAWQVMGFYLLGMDQHTRNLKRFLADVQTGNEVAAQRQKDFYLWYNTVLHFSGGFIKDTYKEVFVKNALVRNRLTIDGARVCMADFPTNVPIWALGGTKDDISPPGQAMGHLNYLPHLPEQNKLPLICDAGHMGLFRSRKVLENHYTQIVEFIKANSDNTPKKS
jgi:polyhydroxyalkanoate depolymerase